jgi:hypothetical protein
MKDQHKNSSCKKSSKSSSDDDSSDDDSSGDDSSDDDLSDSNAAQPKTVKGRGSQAPRGKNLAFQHRFRNLPTAKKRGQTIPYQEDMTPNLRITIFSQPLLARNSQMTCVD